MWRPDESVNALSRKIINGISKVRLQAINFKITPGTGLDVVSWNKHSLRK